MKKRHFNWTAYILFTLFYWLFGVLLVAFAISVIDALLAGAYPAQKTLIGYVEMVVIVVFQFWWLRESARKAAGYVEAGLHPEDIPTLCVDDDLDEPGHWVRYDDHHVWHQG